MSLLNVSQLAFRFPSTEELFRDVSFSVNTGDRLAICGGNGAGKSTLLALIAGDLDPLRGAIARRSGLEIARVEQQPGSGSRSTLLDFVLEARPRLAVLRRHLDDPAAVCDYEEAGGYAAEAEAARALAGLGFSPPEHDAPVAQLSGGQRTRAALARALHSSSDLLLLDEPTNHLDIAAREWLEDRLRSRAGACILVSHDRTLLRRTASRIVEIERGRAILYEGGYDNYRAHRALRERQAWDHYSASQRRKAAAEQAADRRSKLAAKVATPPAGVKSSQDFYARKAAKVARTGRILRERAATAAEVKKPWQEQAIPELDFGEVARCGDIAFTATGLAMSFPSRTLFRDLSFHLTRGERLAIAGPNGSGKTTLLRVLLGLAEPQAGEVRRGANVRAGYFAQDTEDLDLTRTPLEICGASTLPRTLLACLKLRPDRVNQPLRDLSAGERVKVALARLLSSGANVLVLDEPTNHLEIEAQEALEQALAQFPGAILVVSHDREFLSSLQPRVLELPIE